MLFMSGLILTYNEAFRVEVERPFLLALFAGMMGLPVVLRADQWPRLSRGTGDSDSPQQEPSATEAKESS
jgi:hypothetical protein